MSSTAVERLPGPAGEPARRVHVGELGGCDRRGREHGRWSAGHGCTGPPAKNAADGVLGAAAEVAAEHRVAGERDDQQLRVGDLRGDAAGRPTSGVLRSCAPERISVGTSGSGPGGGRRRGGVRPRGAVGDQAVAERGASRRTGRSRARLRAQGASASASRVRGGAVRCQGNGVSSQVVVDEQRFVDLPREPSSLGGFRGHGRDQALREQMQAQQRVGVVAQRRVHRRRQQRAQRRVQVARLEDVEQAELVERDACRWPEPSYTEPLSACLRSCAARRGDVGRAGWR